MFKFLLYIFIIRCKIIIFCNIKWIFSLFYTLKKYVSKSALIFLHILGVNMSITRYIVLISSAFIFILDEYNKFYILFRLLSSFSAGFWKRKVFISYIENLLNNIFIIFEINEGWWQGGIKSNLLFFKNSI